MSAAVHHGGATWNPFPATPTPSTVPASAAPSANYYSSPSQQHQQQHQASSWQQHQQQQYQQQQNPYYAPPAALASSSSYGYGSVHYGGVHYSAHDAASAGAIVLYNPAAQYSGFGAAGLHGGRAANPGYNPFVPGLAPRAPVPDPAAVRYATEDPLKAKFPAGRLQDDPFNWIHESLFNASQEHAKAVEQRRPLTERAH